MYVIFVPITRFPQAANIQVILGTPCLSDVIGDCAYSGLSGIFYIFFSRRYKCDCTAGGTI